MAGQNSIPRETADPFHSSLRLSQYSFVVNANNLVGSQGRFRGKAVSEMLDPVSCCGQHTLWALT